MTLGAGQNGRVTRDRYNIVGEGGLDRLVRMIGLEPTLPRGNRNLNPARLPISPHPQTYDTFEFTTFSENATVVVIVVVLDYLAKNAPTRHRQRRLGILLPPGGTGADVARLCAHSGRWRGTGRTAWVRKVPARGYLASVVSDWRGGLGGTASRLRAQGFWSRVRPREFAIFVN